MDLLDVGPLVSNSCCLTETLQSLHYRFELGEIDLSRVQAGFGVTDLYIMYLSFVNTKTRILSVLN